MSVLCRKEIKTAGRRVQPTGTAPAPPSREPMLTRVTAMTSTAATSTGTAGATTAAAVPVKTAASKSAGETATTQPKASAASTATSATTTTTASAAATAAKEGDTQASATAEKTPEAGESAVEAGDADSEVAKAPARQFEKFINVPTTLVGLLLSKRAKAKTTNINQMQVMTHTIISKMLPAGLEGASPTGKDGDGTDAAVLEGEGQDANGGNTEAVNDDDSSSADSDSDEDEDSESSDGDASQGNGEGDGTDEGRSRTDVADSAAATDGGTSVGATTDGPDGGDGTETAKDTGAVKTAAELAEEDIKRRAIAESERLGYVVFRVLGYHEQNVDTVLQALQDIIAGERIAVVCDKLKITSRTLPWPPNRQPPKWKREAGVPGAEGKVRKERPVKVRDPLRPKSTRLRRTDADGDGGEGAAAAVEGEGDGAGAVPAVSSRYRGKTPRTREQLQADRAAAAESGGKPLKRSAPRGPPREPREPRERKEPREPREPRSKPSRPPAAGGEAAPA